MVWSSGLDEGFTTEARLKANGSRALVTDYSCIYQLIVQ